MISVKSKHPTKSPTLMPSCPPVTAETVVHLKDVAHLTWRQITARTKVSNHTARRWHQWWHKEGRTSQKNLQVDPEQSGKRATLPKSSNSL